MTIPLSPASERRGPRETLLALTETYLRRGELDVESRHCVARLAGRASWRGGERGAQEWGGLAAALAAMLRGEAERAVHLVAAALRAEATPRALFPPLLGLGARAALASDRPALAARWRARVPGPAAGGFDWGALPGGRERAGGGERERMARAVLASLPELVRQFIEVRGEPESRGASAGGPVDGPAEGLRAGALASAAAGTPPAGGDGDDRRREPGADDDDGALPAERGSEGGGGAPGEALGRAGHGGPEEPAETVLHLVIDAYHGELMSLPARVEVLTTTAGDPASDPLSAAWQGGAEAPGGPAGAADDGARRTGGPAGGVFAGGAPEASSTLVTVRVATRAPLPEPPAVAGWRIRFVGKGRAVDASTSDGTLLELDWAEDGVTAVIHPPEWLEQAAASIASLAPLVTHVVLVPEAAGSDLAGLTPGA